MSNIVAEIIKHVDSEREKNWWFLADVVEVSGTDVRFKRIGYPAEDQFCPTLVSYTTPAVDDRVLAVAVGGSCIVIGQLA